jgi:hypothetical protein
MKKFNAVTWNMGGGEGPTGPTFPQVKNVLTEFKDLNVSVGLGQEVQKDENIEFLKSLGYSVSQYGPESIVFWDHRWVAADEFGTVLNPNTPYHRKDNPRDVWVKMARVILCNREGVSLNVGSYHTPSSVQEKNKPPNRIAALKESMEQMSRIAETSKCHGVLLGGDDNVDENEGAWGPWDFMRRKATGLNLVVAPRNTLGKRKVDDFRVKGLRPQGDGRVVHGPTDHNAYVQTFLLPI